MPTLLSFTGLPGVGKTTVARRVAQQTGVLCLRIDEIETAMRASHMEIDDLADGGYAAAQAVARGALRQGYDVIADCVNPIDLTRRAWRQVASDVDAQFLMVAFTCSDQGQHRAQLETRPNDMNGWVGPSWDDVKLRNYEPASDADLQIDTAKLTEEAAAAYLCAALDK